MPSSGWWLASTPIDPTTVRVESISTSSLKTSPSGVRTSTRSGVRPNSAPLLGPLDDVVDGALEQEGRLRDLVVLAREDLLEAADRLGDRHVGAGRARELLGHVERVRQEALDAPRAADDDLVLVGELVDAEDGDDVLQLLVALQDLLDPVGDVEVLLAQDLGLEDRRGRVERVDGRVDALLGDRARERRRGVEMGE